MNTKNQNDTRPIWRGELALLIVVLINSFGVVLMLDSGAGISAISSVPYAFSESFPRMTLGTWTYIFQGTLVAVLMILRKKFVPTYLFSFVVGFAFSKMLDVYKTALAGLPMGLGYQICYFIVSYVVLCIGIALSNRCGLPIIPTDLFPRETAEILKVPYSRVKITFDVTCLAVTTNIIITKTHVSTIYKCLVLGGYVIPLYYSTIFFLLLRIRIANITNATMTMTPTTMPLTTVVVF